MIDCEKALSDLIMPMVDNPQQVSVKQMDSLNENEILLYVYADSEDIARLIGRQGVMASALRQMMSVCARLDNKRINIKFESYQV
jgi:predicted RNA-binding protein YlqC (UPF0109 family)